jgi:hypothetical protein
MFAYSVEVQYDKKWYNWVYRNKLSQARHAKNNLNKVLNADWDKTRIRLVLPRWLRAWL